MKHIVKKNLVIAAAVFTMIITSVSSVFAATAAPAAPTVRPVPGSGAVTSSGSSSSDTSVSGTGSYKATKQDSSDSDTDTDDNSEGTSQGNGTGVTRTVPTPVQANPAATMSVVAEKDRTENISNKKYVTRGAFAVWILLSMLINALFSFWVGNRFYKMSKKDTHIASEIRALRRDIDEKFVGSVGGFTEQETDIANSNEDYSYDEGGITQRPMSKRTAEDDEEFKKWESRLNQRQTSAHSDAMRRKKYQPDRELEYDDDEDETADKSGISSVKSKAKEFLGDIFPFNED